MKKYTQPTPRPLLRAERLRYQWSQQELADRLGISVVTVNRWERGVTAPSSYFRLKLCALFKRSAIDLGLLPDEETTTTLLDYLERYRKHRKALLDRRGTDPLHHPASVVATISLCIEQLHAGAAELLSCCAFLHADNISEQILLTGAPMLGPILENILTNPLEMDLALASLRAFSLLDRSSTNRRLIIHRLVQAVLRDRMSMQTKQQWAERITRAVNLSFPSEISLESMPHCEQLLPQLDLCAQFISLWKLSFPEASQLLQKAGHYLLLRGHPNRAETFLSDALAILQHSSQPPELSLASLLNDLGMVYEEQGKYPQAETTYQQALSLRDGELSDYHDYDGDLSHSFILRDPNKCINCTQCVRVCHDVIGPDCYGMFGKGFDTIVSTPFNISLHDTDCVSCGACVQVCPTGSLMMAERHLARYAFALDRCIFCGDCVEVCPHGALGETPNFELSFFHRFGEGVTLEKQDLAEAPNYLLRQRLPRSKKDLPIINPLVRPLPSRPLRE